VADGLNVVAVRVEGEGAVVAGVVDRAPAGWAVVGTAGGERGGVEGVDLPGRALRLVGKGRRERQVGDAISQPRGGGSLAFQRRRE